MGSCGCFMAEAWWSWGRSRWGGEDALAESSRIGAPFLLLSGRITTEPKPAVTAECMQVSSYASPVQ